MVARLRTARRLRAAQGGFTLIELLVVLVMLLIVVTTLSATFVSAANVEQDMNRRFGSQINARIALDQLRREIHCAATVTPTASTWLLTPPPVSSITIVLGSRCPSGSAGLIVSWCTVGSGSRWALYRLVGISCDATGRKTVDYLTTGNVFSYYTSQSLSNLAYLTVDLPVNVNPASGEPDYRLQDDIVLRNSVRV